MRRAVMLACMAAVGLTAGLSACSAGDSTPAGTPPAVVASTDVWGSVARAVTGDDARVTSIVTGQVDPHSFEPAPAAVAELEDATVAVYNGGGYDAWVDDVLDHRPGIAAVDAYALLPDPARSGRDGSRANEHVFYDLPTATAVANRIADLLAGRDPNHASGYHSRATQFGVQADRILQREKALRARFPGVQVLATEPVAHYLLTAAGLTDVTPEGFRNAVEQDSDPSPADMAAALDLITGREVSALIVNDQTITGAIRQLSDAARAAGVPVVPVTETLPAGSDYLSWQSATVDRLTDALGQPR